MTTPIYYVNDVPHLGHAYTTLAADILARFERQRLDVNNVFFLTGTDEHGANIAQAAEKHGKSPQAYVDEVAPRFQETWQKLNIKPDYFIRTTDPRHEKIATQILEKIRERYIYEGVYEGWYCLGCEKFLTELEMVEGKCPLHPTREPDFQKEENYFFKLKELAPQILRRLEEGEYQILPTERHNEIISRLKQDVEDISISRAGVSWGIPVPWDKNQTIYVWFEALLNYYTATQFVAGKQEFWPPGLQLMAKDILWFHAVIWPAILIAAELPLPKTIFAHGFFTLNGQKMSKSLGNVISPEELVQKFGVDGTRYLLMSQYPFGADGDINLDKFKEKYKGDLADGLGNLVSRITKLGESLSFPTDKLDISQENVTIKNIETFLLDPEHPNFLRIDLALDIIWRTIRGLDTYISKERPWENEASDDKRKLGKIVVVGHALELLHEIAEALEPFLPETSKNILLIFNQPKITKIEKPLFPRL